MNQEIMFLINSFYKSILRIGLYCPACGCPDSQVHDRKYLVISLRRCTRCKLLFRAPITTVEENQRYYQSDYRQGLVTDLPSSEVLKTLMSSNFVGTELDYSDKISILNAIGCKNGVKLFDYGCSWGYGSWQLVHSGYDVLSYEISKPRAEYAREYLELNICDTIDAIEPGQYGMFDIFFSSHVLEHVPSPAKVLDLALNLLKPGGYLVIFTPNGSAQFRKRYPSQWHMLWGLVHPNFLDDVYYENKFSNMPRLLASFPYDIEAMKKAHFFENEKIELDLHGYELLFVTQKH